MLLFASIYVQCSDLLGLKTNLSGPIMSFAPSMWQATLFMLGTFMIQWIKIPGFSQDIPGYPRMCAHTLPLQETPRDGLFFFSIRSTWSPTSSKISSITWHPRPSKCLGPGCVHRKSWRYTLVMTNIAKGKITIFHGRTHYKWSCSIAMLNYQGVFLWRMLWWCHIRKLREIWVPGELRP